MPMAFQAICLLRVDINTTLIGEENVIQIGRPLYQTRSDGPDGEQQLYIHPKRFWEGSVNIGIAY